MTATPDTPVDEALLDQLVPPPGPRWRRAVLWLAFLALVGTFTWAAATGTVIPQISTEVQRWGGSGPVAISVSVDNASPVAIDVVHGPRPRPGLTLLGYTSGPESTIELVPAEDPSDPFPLRLDPRGSIDITIWYRVDDCEAVRAIGPEDDQIDLQVRIADGPASWFTAERAIDAEDLAMEPDAPSSWPATVARYACPT